MYYMELTTPLDSGYRVTTMKLDHLRSVIDEDNAVHPYDTFHNTYTITSSSNSSKFVVTVLRETAGGPIIEYLGSKSLSGESHTRDYIFKELRKSHTSFFRSKTVTVQAKTTRRQPPPRAQQLTPPSTPEPLELTTFQEHMYHAGFNPGSFPATINVVDITLTLEEKLKVREFLERITPLAEAEFSKKWQIFKLTSSTKAADQLLAALQRGGREGMFARGEALSTMTPEEYGYVGLDLTDLPELDTGFKDQSYDAYSKELLLQFAHTKRNSPDLPRAFQDLKTVSPHLAAAFIKVLVEEGIDKLRMYVRAVINAPNSAPTSAESSHPAFTGATISGTNSQVVHPAMAKWSQPVGQARLFKHNLADSQIEPAVLASLPSHYENMGVPYENEERAAIKEFLVASEGGGSLKDAWFKLRAVSPKSARYARDLLARSGLERMLHTLTPLSREIRPFIQLQLPPLGSHLTWAYPTPAEIETLTEMSFITEGTPNGGIALGDLYGKLSRFTQQRLLNVYRRIPESVSDGVRHEKHHLAGAAEIVACEALSKSTEHTKIAGVVPAIAGSSLNVETLYTGESNVAQHNCFTDFYAGLSLGDQKLIHGIAKDVEAEIGFDEGFWDRSLDYPLENLDRLVRLQQLTTTRFLNIKGSSSTKTLDLMSAVIATNREISERLHNDPTLVNRVYQEAFEGKMELGKIFMNHVIRGAPYAGDPAELSAKLEQIQKIMEGVLKLDSERVVSDFDEQRALQAILADMQQVIDSGDETADISHITRGFVELTKMEDVDFTSNSVDACVAMRDFLSSRLA